jgi:hypothetical protein
MRLPEFVLDASTIEAASREFATASSSTDFSSLTKVHLWLATAGENMDIIHNNGLAAAIQKINERMTDDGVCIIVRMMREIIDQTMAAVVWIDRIEQELVHTVLVEWYQFLNEQKSAQISLP